ncbi:hypothetical protein BIW11_09264 [Tropilaelaps mercedesae]|uniref:Uncharacterized protein n=1 Tax=Tropilaelaps mercedesae TaxID=418985 RepID=A0A1V9XL83_9ACAR|nr:hypothetical protein BIW11_09264 [Tropilaelaps mercedesae]
MQQGQHLCVERLTTSAASLLQEDTNQLEKASKARNPTAKVPIRQTATTPFSNVHSTQGRKRRVSAIRPCYTEHLTSSDDWEWMPHMDRRRSAKKAKKLEKNKIDGDFARSGSKSVLSLDLVKYPEQSTTQHTLKRRTKTDQKIAHGLPYNPLKTPNSFVSEIPVVSLSDSD